MGILAWYHRKTTRPGERRARHAIARKFGARCRRGKWPRKRRRELFVERRNPFAPRRSRFPFAGLVVPYSAPRFTTSRRGSGKWMSKLTFSINGSATQTTP